MRPLGGSENGAVDFVSDACKRGVAFEDAAGIDIHVALHTPVGLGIGADLDRRRDRRPENRAAAGRVEQKMRPRRGKLRELG